uniref:C2H2-type domain-containing protein n=1 Tax=Schistocephalus solidus TaxID=70667 RepID=A0A183T2C8_SCHSO
LKTEHQITEQHLASHPKDLYTVGHICSHCGLICSSSLDLANHFTTTHCRLPGSNGSGAKMTNGTSAGSTPCESQCYFCCFNSCRRIYASAEELRQHLSSCPLAYRDLSVTFGRALNCQVPGKDQTEIPSPTPATEMVTLPTADPSDPQKPNPLCFCLYCGVGVGKRNSPGPVNPQQHQQPSAQQADQSEHADAPATASFPLVLEFNTEDSRPASSSNSGNEAPSASPATTPSAIALPVPVNCASTFFPNIASLHAHERGHISYGGTGQIGCPWCGERLAYSRFEDIQTILDHIFTHARDNRYVVWHLNRRKLQNKHPEEFLQCYCGAALDCPLAVCAHATQLPNRLDVDCPLTAHLRPACEAASAHERAHQADEVGKLSRPTVAAAVTAGRKSETANGATGGGSGAGAAPRPAPDLCCRNSVIRSPLLPASHAPVSGRVFDHTRLCYVCCRHEHQNSNEPPTGSNFDCSDQTKEVQQTAAPSDSPNSPNGDATPQSPRSTNTTDFWQHVFDCMLSRHLALLKEDSGSTVAAACEAPDEVDIAMATDEMLATDQEMEGVETDEEEDEIMESDQGEASASVPEPLSSPPSNTRSLAERSDLLIVEPPGRGLPSSPSTSLSATDRASLARSSSAVPRLVLSTSSALVSLTTVVPSSPSLSNSPTKSSLSTPCESSQPPKMPRLEPSIPTVTPALKTSPITASVPTLSPQVSFPVQPSCTVSTSTAPSSDGQVKGSVSVPNNEESVAMRVCIICGSKCTWDTYEEHMLEHRSPLLDWHGPLNDSTRKVSRDRQSIYRCHICERRFLQRTSVARHMLFFHKVEKTSINWDDLRETSGNELLANAPMANRLPTFTARLPFDFSQPTAPPSSARNGALSVPPLLSCAFCSAQFKNRKQLRQHVLATHPSPENSIWLSCPDCGLQFLSKKSLKIHTRGTHHRSLLASEDGLQPEVPEIL